MRISSCLTAAIASLSIGITALAAPPALEVGQPFPEITLPSAQDGTPMSIASFRGKKVILHVFASW